MFHLLGVAQLEPEEKELYKKELLAANPSLATVAVSATDKLVADKFYKA